MIKNGKKGSVTRREFLELASLSAAGLFMGCAVNPVTGEQQLMMVSREEEIQMDRQHSKYQFSSDYGTIQDRALGDYIAEVGNKLVPYTHRKNMPYSFRGVNATYVNAYAFPGGSIAVTRGILLKLDNEAELAALLGHELGHVNARHTAEQMSKSQLASGILGLGTMVATSQSEALGSLTSQLGQLGAGMLLASYSRENEREADALGNRYMVDAGYSTDGFVGLMEMLNSSSKAHKASSEILFATHPMSDERYDTALVNSRKIYHNSEKNPLFKERFMDHTQGLRKNSLAIDMMQKGNSLMDQNRNDDAQKIFASALKSMPDDYACLMMMAKCQLVLEKYDRARSYCKRAKQVYPGEAQAYLYGGFAGLKTGGFEDAYGNFDSYDAFLPGNPDIVFFKGYCLEQMDRTKEAAEHYYSFLQGVKEGDHARHAYQSLVKWGYLKE